MLSIISRIAQVIFQPTRDLIVKHQQVHVGSSQLGPCTKQAVAYNDQKLSTVCHSEDAMAETLDSSHHQTKKQVSLVLL